MMRRIEVLTPTQIQIKSTIQKVFEKAHQEGFDHNRVEAALHQMELSRKHVSNQKLKARLTLRPLKLFRIDR
jgi:Zn-dependent M16 (insulinase) family peptidase